MRRFSALVFAVSAALFLAGCGDDKSPGEKAFGDLSSQDKAAIERYTKVAEQWPDQFAKLVTAETAQDVTAMRRAVDELTETASQAQDTVLDFDNAKARDDFSAHADGYEGVASALDGYVAYYEDESTPVDQAAEAALAQEVERAARELASADRKVFSRLLDATPAEDRPALRAKLREQQKQFEEQATGESP